jgi:hypothetical protein
LGPSIVYSERTNEELEELFRTIIDDEEFLNVCQKEFKQRDKFNKEDLPSFIFSTNKDDYEEVPATTENDNQSKPRVVHEINMSIYYDFQVNQENSDLKFVKRYINIIPEENENKKKNNRFSTLNLSNDIDRLVKMHDFVHHSQQQQQQQQEIKITKPEVIPHKKSTIKRRQTCLEPRRRTTIPAISDTHEFDSAALARIVEEQLEAARFAAAIENFIPKANPSSRMMPINRTRFIEPASLISQSKEQSLRHRIDDIEYPKTNINCLLRKPCTFVNNTVSQPIPSQDEREKLLILGQQGIISSAVALGSQKIPDNIKSIELLEIPNTKTNENQYQDFRMISYETLDNYPINTAPLLRRAKSMRHMSSQTETTHKRPSPLINDGLLDTYAKLTSPLKSIRRNIRNKHETAINNKPVFKEKIQGRKW